MDKQAITDQPYDEYLAYARRNLLNILEASYGQDPSWTFIRSRVLQIFGQEGLGRYCSINKEKKYDRNGSSTRTERGHGVF
jgi:hypothetical protein